jgi:quinol monooxygenase YgiN
VLQYPPLAVHSTGIRYRKLIALLLGITIVFLSMSHISGAQTLKSAPFSLFVTLMFSEVQYKDQFLKDFATIAAYVRDHEPTTLAYETLQSDSNPLKVLILERYQDKENAYLKIHKSSQDFLDFRPKLKELKDAGHVTIDGHSYVDTMTGFGDRVKE